ncbi:MAG: MFS transporter [Chloroflexi bacterium]|nr:MAG: MFS transporter [Chloroflexota bacterium]
MTTSAPADATRETKPSLWTRSYILAVIASHLYFFTYHASIVEVPASLTDQPPWIIGLVVGAMGMAGMIFRPLVGVWLDGGNRVRLARLGAIGTTIAFIGYGLDLGPWAMLAFRLLHGMTMAMFTTALLAVVGASVPPASRGAGIGLYQTAGAVGQLYAAPIAIAVAVVAGMNITFLLTAGVVFVSLVTASMVRDTHAPAVVTTPLPWRQRAWVSKTAFLPALVFLCVTAPWGAVTTFLIEFADERALTNVGLFYTMVAATQVLSRASVGWLADRLTPALTVIPALMAATTSLLLLSVTRTETMLLVAGLLFGLGLASTQTSMVALVVSRTAPAGLGSAMATYTIAWDVGLVLGGTLFGFVVNATSPATTFAIISLMPIAGAALFLLRVARDPA